MFKCQEIIVRYFVYMKITSILIDANHYKCISYLFVYLLELSEPEVNEENDQFVTQINSSKRCKKPKKKKNK